MLEIIDKRGPQDRNPIDAQDIPVGATFYGEIRGRDGTYAGLFWRSASKIVQFDAPYFMWNPELSIYNYQPVDAQLVITQNAKRVSNVPDNNISPSRPIG